MSDNHLMLDCSVCGQNLELTTDEPVQWQQAFDLWHREHKHTRAELQRFYKSESATADEAE